MNRHVAIDLGASGGRVALGLIEDGRLQVEVLHRFPNGGTWLPTGLIAHVQVNDPNRRAPGQGELRFAPVFAALRRHGYDATVSVEPFDYVPDGVGAAAFAAGYLRGVRESIAPDPTSD